jgi:hypothetical protein
MKELRLRKSRQVPSYMFLRYVVRVNDALHDNFKRACSGGLGHEVDEAD